MMVTPAQRFFSYAGVTLPDLNRQMSPEEIKSATRKTSYPFGSKELERLQSPHNN